MAGLFVCAVIALLPLTLIAVLGYRAGRPGRVWRRVMRLGQPTVAWVSICNVNSREGERADGWVLALLSPDPRVTIDDLARVLKSINAYMDMSENNEDLASAYGAAAIAPRYWEGFRERIPDSVTCGQEIYAAHIWVFQADTPRRLAPGGGNFPLPCRVIWDEEGSMMCSRPDGWPRPAAKAVAAGVKAPTLDVRGPFAARFLTVSQIPFVRELQVRLACAVGPTVQGQPWRVSEATRNLQIAVQDPAHPHAAAARPLFYAKADEPPVRLPNEFAQGEEIWLFGARLAVDDLPAETRDRWAVPQDLFCAFVKLDGSTGRLTFAEKPADNVLGRQRQRVRAAERNGGVPIYAVLVQANTSLFHPGEDDQPATVVYSPDPVNGIDRLRWLADFIAGLKGKDQADPDMAALSEYVTNETACPYRRRLVAERLTGGLQVFIADLHVYRGLLAKGTLHGRDTLLCIAEPGLRGGSLELMEENLHLPGVPNEPASTIVGAVRGGRARR